MEEYVKAGHCLHSALFAEQWKDSWMDGQFAAAKNMLRQGITLAKLQEEGIIREEVPGVYSIPTFTREVCDMIIAETDNFIKFSLDHGISIHRPNSMNKYGLVLNLMGMREILTDLQQNFFLPLSRVMYPIEGCDFSGHHTFIVSYDCSRDKSLDMHTDDSDVTWNICLGKEGFAGSGLTFCGQLAAADHRQLQGHYNHIVGRAVCHLGHQRHGADVISGGERHNLIMWCKNEVYRSSELFEKKMRAYEKESGPPNVQCLSYTHDRDYIAFKEYPPGKNPYSLDSDSESGESDTDAKDGSTDSTAEASAHQSLPWCPPSQFGYAGLYTHNKLMLLHFEKEVEKEEQKAKRQRKTEI